MNKTLVRVRNCYMKAPTKILLAFNKRISKIPHSRVSDFERKMAVKGTLDILANRLPIYRNYSKEHDIDKGYYKQVRRLSEYGKKLLDKYRK